MQTNFISPLLLVLIVALILMSIIAIFYLYIAAKSRERLALIEKGMNPNLSRSDVLPQACIIAAGISIGIMVSDLMQIGTYGPLMGIILAGVGLVIFNIMRKSKMVSNSKS